MKNYSIMRVCAAKPYLFSFNKYFNEKSTNSKDYASTLSAFQTSGFLTPGSWSTHIQNLGNQAIDVVPDFTLLQEQWIQENAGLTTFSKKYSLTDIFLMQIKYYRPDIIYFERGGFLTITHALRKNIKQLFPFVKIITGLWGDELNGNHQYSDFNDLDLIFCTYPALKYSFEKIGIHSHLNHLCFDDTLSERIIPNNVSHKKNDFIFPGTTGYGIDEHRDRYFDLKELLNKTPLQIWTKEETLSLKTNLIRSAASLLTHLDLNTLNFFLSLKISRHDERIGHLIGYSIRKKQDPSGSCLFNWKKHKPLSSLYPERCFPPRFGMDYFELIYNSRIVFNRHRVDKTEFANIRTFETTGMGACLLTDRANEAASLFEKDREIVSYESIPEAIEKVNFLLHDEKQRQAIADAGKRRTLRDHTAQNRCLKIHEVFVSL
ncbi:MAG: glycosyltransferase [bacterium]|nr:glycosyltransferase [bacterium]